MEYIVKLQHNRPRLGFALFDFDGTISTLRYGWERVMEPLMLEMIGGPGPVEDVLAQEVREYIDQSAGIQTYYQMKWLAETVKRHGKYPGAPEDPWWYKAEYNRRLMESVEQRKAGILSGKVPAEAYMIRGSEVFLNALAEAGIELYVASGTDDPDVNREVDVLGLRKYFKRVAGAPIGRADCSKEAVLRSLIRENHLQGPEVVVVGDGKVEIALGREMGAITLGVASDEEQRYGVNPIKYSRLLKAGAHAITGDFGEPGALLEWLETSSSGR